MIELEQKPISGSDFRVKEYDNLKEIIKEKDADIQRLNGICIEFAKTKISIQK